MNSTYKKHPEILAMQIIGVAMALGSLIVLILNSLNIIKL
jgi:hypothetical protein